MPSAITRAARHPVVQAAMGRFDQHLWKFAIDRRRTGPPNPGGWNRGRVGSAAEVPLGDALPPRRTTISHLYDFGDGWERRLVVGTRGGDPATL